MHIHVHFTYALTRCKHLLNAQMHIHQAVNIHTYVYVYAHMFTFVYTRCRDENQVLEQQQQHCLDNVGYNQRYQFVVCVVIDSFIY